VKSSLQQMIDIMKETNILMLYRGKVTIVLMKTL